MLREGEGGDLEDLRAWACLSWWKIIFPGYTDRYYEHTEYLFIYLLPLKMFRRRLDHLRAWFRYHGYLYSFFSPLIYSGRRRLDDLRAWLKWSWYTGSSTSMHFLDSMTGIFTYIRLFLFYSVSAWKMFRGRDDLRAWAGEVLFPGRGFGKCLHRVFPNHGSHPVHAPGRFGPTPRNSDSQDRHVLPGTITHIIANVSLIRGMSRKAKRVRSRVCIYRGQVGRVFHAKTYYCIYMNNACWWCFGVSQGHAKAKLLAV